MFDAILFDFDGTLVDFVAADTHSLKWLHTQIGAGVCFDDFLETAVDEIMKFHALVAEHKIDPLLMHPFRLQNTFARYAIPWDDRYVSAYQKKLVELSIPFEGVISLLAGIRPKAKTGLVTNAYDGKEQRERIKNAGLEPYFDVIVVACEVDAYKPDPEIFHHTLERLQVSPARSLYIGDSITHDTLGAKAAGLKTVLFSQTAARSHASADYCAQGIRELQTLLNHLV